MQYPFVSVIIPTYNRLSLLEEALQSVLNQTLRKPIEIIVVDDHSQDGTSEIIPQKYPEVRLISFKQNQGVSSARNQALLIAQGKYIAFLDSDDLWEPNYLESQLQNLETQEKSFSVTAITEWNTLKNCKTIVSQTPNLTKFISPIHQLLVKSSFIISPSSVVFPREIFQDVGLFDETYRIGADRGLYVSCLVNDYQMIFVDQPLAIIRKHDKGQLTDFNASKIEQRKLSRILYLEKLYPLIEKKQLACASINRLYAEIYSIAAREYYRSKCYRLWIKHWIKVAKHTSLFYALFNIIRDLLRFSKKYLPNSWLNLIRQKFLSKTLSI
jgi:glycosyltransferase involved in cell wall biosynthesis